MAENLREEEQALVQAMLAGSESAQQRLVEMYWRRLYRAAVHFLGYQDPEAEDVVQETFAVAFAKLSEFRHESSLYTWLNQICVFQCYHRIRARKRLLLGQEDEIQALPAPDSAGAGDEAALREQRLAALRSGIGRLKQPCQDLLRLRDLEGQAYAALSKALSLPMGTVMSRLARCRETLKKMLSSDASLWTSHE